MTPLDHRTWDEFVTAHPAGSQAQSSGWGDYQATRGWIVVRHVARRDDDIAGVVQALERRVPGVGVIRYVDRGPLGIDAAAVEELASKVARPPGSRRARVVIADPPDEAGSAALGTIGYLPANVKLTLAATTRIDLSGTDDEILAAMKSKTRYNVRKGVRAGVTVREGGVDDIAAFHAMLEDTGRRQRFAATSRSQLEQLLAILGPRGEAVLLLAEHEGDMLAGILLTAFGDRATYKRGAWSGRDAALHPNEVLHWEAMRWARRHRLRWYDFDGVDPAVAAEIERGGALSAKAEQSVTRFKLGFGGGVVPLPPTLVLIPNPVGRLVHDRILPRARRYRPVKRALRRLQVG